ncbi:MAG: Holliday junction resolvase RuvX [Candidatus Coatesbacteria bacterium]|nr:MAG: Holliday junction resolvase RuvX [Candidatus Coatesbacteria bacterium]
MRILAIDWGEARVGLAMTDELEIIASPHDVLPNNADVYERIAALVAEKGVGKIIVGLPVTLSGEESAAAEAARAFAEDLGARVAVPVELFDERMTTRAAERAMREGGAGEREVKEKADAVAAALLLETYLQYISNQNETPTTDE